MSQPLSSQPPIPHSPDPTVVALGGGSTVRRHHTISSSSRRPNSRAFENEAEELNEHDIVGEDWVGAPIGDKSGGLFRQSSLPSRYNRAMRPPGGSRSGALTPSKTVGGLSTLDAGHEDDDWEHDIRATRQAENEEYHQQQYSTDDQASDPNSGYGASPPLGSAGVRRHQSMTYGNTGPKRAVGGLQRSGTVSGKARSRTMNATTEAPDDEDNYAGQYIPHDGDSDEFDEPGSFHGHGTREGSQGAGGQVYSNSTSPNPWSQGQAQDGVWRSNQGAGDWRTAAQMDDLSRAMGNIDIQQQQGINYAHGGPRFNPGVRQPSPGLGPQQYLEQGQAQHQRKLQLVTDVNQSLQLGPQSASAYVPPIGHGPGGPAQGRRERSLTGRSSNPNINQAFNQYGQQQQFGNMPPPPPIPTHYLNQPGNRFNNQNPGNVGGNFGPESVPMHHPPPAAVPQPSQSQLQPGNPATYLSSPIDVPTMIAQKGYNPAAFDIRPPFARYFVIKSYTEDDVHKSLKYEIWSSTDPGNKRLDKAFRECAGRGPIYLFFSVNASGHFCGMAEMLTPVDYTRSSTVWASDKWKGVFKVKWIFVRDIPNSVLRNIRLKNTQELKPVTNSRDTQELLPDAGQEMLKFFFMHPARTSLLQDFAFYELQSMQKDQTQRLQSPPPPAGAPSQLQPQQAQLTSPHQGGQAPLAAQQHPYAMPNPHTPSYGHPAQASNGVNMMPPMLNPNSYAPAPQVVQGVLRGPSPGLHGNGAYGLGGGGGNVNY